MRGRTTKQQGRPCPRACTPARSTAAPVARGMAPTALTSRHAGARTGVVCIFFQRPPAYRTIKLASRGGECKSLVCCHNTQHRRKPFAFNRRQLLVSSSHRAERVSCAGSCWSSQEGWSAAAMSVGGYELPNGTAGSLAHSGPRESDPDRRARAAELLPAPAVLIT